ncbi:MAG: hypothetical protein ACM3VS_13340 [Candidatus Dadabacteria bacterium]
MIHKYLLTNKHKLPPVKPVLPVSEIIMYIGIVVLLAAFIYMILDIDHADSIAALWLPFVIAGVLLVFLGLMVIQMHQHKVNRHRHHY